MTDTTISGALCWPQDVGSGVPEDEEDYSSAGFFSLLSKYKGEGSYVGEDTSGNPTLQFNDVDTSNEQVDISTGYAYIMDSMSVQSGFQTVYDVALPNESPYVVILPDEVVNLDLGTDNTNDIWLAVDPNSNDSVYIRHGNGLTAPTDPNVKLGTVDTSSGATTRTNDGAPSGAFRDEDGDNVYTLPNASDGIDVGSVSTDELLANAVTMFVRDSGSDSNDGLSAANAKATFNSAIEDAPIQGDQSSALVIDLAAETLTGTAEVVATELSVPVLVQGATDGSGNPATTIDVSGMTNFVFARYGLVSIENIQFVGQHSHPYVLAEGSTTKVSVDNCDMPGTGDSVVVSCASGATVSVTADCSVTWDTDSSTANELVSWLGGEIVWSAPVSVTGTGSPSVVVRAFDGAGTIDWHGDISGNGNVDTIFYVQGPVHVKVGDNTYDGADYLVQLSEQAAFIAQGGLSNTSVNSGLIKAANGGYFANGDDNAEWMGVPSSVGTPSEAASVPYAPLWYDRTGGDGRLTTNRRGTSQIVRLGVHDKNDPAASDVLDGALVFDTANNRLVYRDQSGTVHYWTTDGTL